MPAQDFNIADLFEMVADTVPDRDAIVCGDKRVTFKQLDERSNQLAHFLQSKGIKPGDHIGLYMYNCLEYLESMLACFKIRAVPINVNYRYVKDELLYIFSNANVIACIHGREFIPAIREIKHAAPKMHLFICVEDGSKEDLQSIGAIEYDAARNGQSTVRNFAERSGDDLFILYTGGTTGMPKGVMWPHKNVFVAAMNAGGHFSPNGPCKVPSDIKTRVTEHQMSGIALAPLMHGASWWYACIQLLAGNKLVLNHNRSLNGEEVWSLVEKEQCHAVQIVGDAMAIPLIDAFDKNPGRWNLSSVFNIGSGGAVFSDSKQQKFKQIFPNCFVTNAFGSSESGQMGLDSGQKKTEGGLGNVHKGDFMSVIIEEETPMRHAKAGETGIFARAGHIPVGYYGDPEKTAKTFVPLDGKIWLLTGDAAKLEDDGLSISVFGRGSNCINSGGEKVFVEEVEQALKANPQVYDALVVATPDERWGSKVTAIVEAREGQKLTLASIQEDARKYIAGYKVPRELHLVGKIQRLPNGKPDYKSASAFALSRKGLMA
jgi:acyl-CoA synthetase (AMP-forming)/AMP-acid ligase II